MQKHLLPVILAGILAVAIGSAIPGIAQIGPGPGPVTGGGGITTCAPAGASSTAYTCAPSPALGSYSSGGTTTTLLDFDPDVNGAGGAMTVNVSALGAKSIKQSDCTTNPGATDFVAGVHVALVYNGTVFCELDGATNLRVISGLVTPTLPSSGPETYPVVSLAGAGAGNVDNGRHEYGVSFLTAGGETQASYCIPTIVVADKTVDGKVTVTLPTGGSAVVGRRVYRTRANTNFPGSLPDCAAMQLLTQVNDNITTTFTDNVSDLQLGDFLSNSALTSGTGWTRTGGFALTSNTAVFTAAGGSPGTLTATAQIAPFTVLQPYTFTYSVKALTGTPVCEVTSPAGTIFGNTGDSTFDVSSVADGQIDYPYLVNTGPWVISCTGTGTDAVTLDDLYLTLDPAYYVNGPVDLSGGRITNVVPAATNYYRDGLPIEALVVTDGFTLASGPFGNGGRGAHFEGSSTNALRITTTGLFDPNLTYGGAGLNLDVNTIKSSAYPIDGSYTPGQWTTYETLFTSGAIDNAQPDFTGIPLEGADYDQAHYGGNPQNVYGYLYCNAMKRPEGQSGGYSISGFQYIANGLTCDPAAMVRFNGTTHPTFTVVRVAGRSDQSGSLADWGLMSSDMSTYTAKAAVSKDGQFSSDVDSIVLGGHTCTVTGTALACTP